MDQLLSMLEHCLPNRAGIPSLSYHLTVTINGKGSKHFIFHANISRSKAKQEPVTPEIACSFCFDINKYQRGLNKKPNNKQLPKVLQITAGHKVQFQISAAKPQLSNPYSGQN